MKYQILIAGYGGQGAVFLVKLLSIAAANKGYACLGTENHGMSQRGGSVSCGIKIGDFFSPNIDENSADLLIALEQTE
ncbi:MAG: 2-oxoacid:acceptor oxidoreductase family protein, partial [Campylobacter sp.]|nr:2-oxoacid:acceptor oxidoreductase family protein [Campylobacter sp.]